jgi:FkbM family methyltransferase
MKNYFSKKRRLFLNFLEKYFLNRIVGTNIFFVYEFFIFLLHFRFIQLKLFSKREEDLFFINSENNEKFYFFNRFRVRRYITSGSLEIFCKKLLKKYFFKEIKDDLKIVFDIGSNIGEFAYNFKNTETVCHCFEIDPLTLKVLNKNLFNYNNFIINNLAVSEKSGKSNFYLDSMHASSSLLENDKLQSIIVNTITLDDYIELNNISFIDLIKIEAEGAEPEILYGFKKNLRKSKYIVIDCTPERYGQSTMNQCQEFLKLNNFDCTSLGYYLFATNSIFKKCS